MGQVPVYCATCLATQHHSALHHSTVHCTTAQCTAPQRSALHHSTVHCTTSQCTAPQHSALHCTTAQCTALHCMLHCILRRAHPLARCCTLLHAAARCYTTRLPLQVLPTGVDTTLLLTPLLSVVCVCVAHSAIPAQTLQLPDNGWADQLAWTQDGNVLSVSTKQGALHSCAHTTYIRMYPSLSLS